MNRSMPGLPVHHQLPEFTQSRVHRVSDAIQPSHPLSCPSPPALKPSQHQSLFQWVNSSHEVAKVLECQLQHHSLQRNPRADLLQNGLVGSPCSPKDSQEYSTKQPLDHWRNDKEIKNTYRQMKMKTWWSKTYGYSKGVVAYLRKPEKRQINCLMLHLKWVEKEKQNSRLVEGNKS